MHKKISLNKVVVMCNPPSFQKPKRTSAYTLFLPFLILTILLFPALGFAQVITDLPSIEQLQVNNENSTAGKIFASMFGKEFAGSPLTQIGSATGLLGSIFFVFNGALFVVGTAFILYNTIMMVAVSAHKGEVLGERMSSLWIPIRLGTGIFGMAPVFMGFSLAQAVMFMIAILGNNLGDMMAKKAVEMNDAFNVIVPAPGLSNSTQTPVMIDHKIGEGLFTMHVCQQVYANYQDEINDGTTPFDYATLGITYVLRQMFPGAKPQVVKGKDGSIFVLGTKIVCGGVRAIDQVDEAVRDKGGYKNPAVQYDLIANSAKEIFSERKKILVEMNDEIEALAGSWSKPFFATKSEDKKKAIQYPAKELFEIVEKASKKEQAAISKSLDKILKKDEGGVVTKAAKEKMLDGGWMTLGSWYATFAESNAAVQSAAMSARFEAIPMDIKTKKKLPDQVLIVFDKLMVQQSDVAQTCPAWYDKHNSVNSLGVCAPMQNILRDALEVSVGNTGGTLIAKGIANLAAISSVALEAIPVVGKGLKAAADLAVHGSEKMAIASTGFGRMLLIFANSPIWGAILTISFILGVILAVYIPLVPFITWFTASISYFASVVEGLIAAQIWAFSHLHTDGEGMGQRAEKGYLYMLNMLLRPALMILGFFFASSIMVLLGTFLFNQIEPAVANIQGDTTTGPLILFGLVAVFMTVTISLVQTVFNMIYEIPDRVIAWFGHGMEARMAKEMDKDTENKMGRAAAWGAGALLAKGVGGGAGALPAKQSKKERFDR